MCCWEHVVYTAELVIIIDHGFMRGNVFTARRLVGDAIPKGLLARDVDQISFMFTQGALNARSELVSTAGQLFTADYV